MNKFNNTQIIEILKAKLSFMKQEVKKVWNIDIEGEIKFSINNSNVLGFYRPYTKEIHLNKTLLFQYGELYINEVVVHEYAHAVINTLYPYGLFGDKSVRTHGKEFKEVCLHFGNRGTAFVSLFSCPQTRNRQNKTASEIRRGL